MLILAINSLYNENGHYDRYPYYGPDSGGVALTCSLLGFYKFLCPALLGIVFRVSLLQDF